MKVNYALILGSPVLKEKHLEDCSSSVNPKSIVKLCNSLEHPQKFPEVFGNSLIIFGNCDNPQDKNLMPLAQKKLAGILCCQVSLQDHKVRVNLLELPFEGSC